MRRLLAHRAWLPASAVALVGVAIRLNNALRYPPDWGFDASFNWRYIYRLTKTWELPAPDAAWAAADPPLYFYLSGLIMRACQAAGHVNAALVAIPVLSALAGLATIALAVALVRRADPTKPRRALLAGGLLLFLPAHIHMSAMVNEEMLAALLTSLALFALARPGLAAEERHGRAAAVGLAGGLAVLTKLSGALTAVAAAATYALDGWRRSALRPAATHIAVLTLVTALVGGWFYARNRIEYGYFQPHGLAVHRLMFGMPPGERRVGDYLRLPLATWTDPQLLNPDLLRSVWGSTYATIWFDGHRYFLPRDEVSVQRLGTATLLLALLPSLAFAIGVGRGLRRAFRSPESIDPPLLLLLGITLAGYVLYTWLNPWFAVVKGTSLLGLSLPFAFYTSEVLERWTRGRGAAGVWLLLVALAVCATLSSSFGLAFQKTEISGLQWAPTEGP